MPLQAPTPDASDDSDKTILPDLSNGFTQEATESYTLRIESLQAQIDDIMAKARIACQPFKDDMKELKKAAAEVGFEKKAFNASLRARRLKAKAATASSSLSDTQRWTFDQIELFQQKIPLPGIE